VKLLNEQGVEVRYNSTVRKINIENNHVTGVTLENGQVLYSDLVVSNADTAWTYKNLIDAKYRKVWTDKKVDNGKYSMSLFVWYFGTKKKCITCSF
jgi:phytoene desaturase